MTLLSQWNDSQTVKEAAVRGSVRGDCKPEEHKTAFSQRVGGRPLTAAVDGSCSCTWVWQKHCETLSTSVVRRSKHQVDVPGGSEAAVTSCRTQTQIPPKISELIWVMRPEGEDEAAGCCFYTGVVVLAHEGKESRLNMTRPQLLMARLMQPIPRTFITTPALACRGRNARDGGGH